MKTVRIYLASRISIPRSELPPDLLGCLKQYLTFDNPRYEEAKKRRFGTRGIDKKILCYQEQGDFFHIYRGYMGNLIAFLGQNGYQHEIIEQRRLLPEIDLCFRGDLHTYQTRAATQAIKKQFGILVAPCGSGKTVIGLHIIAERKQPTLIIVHTKELLNQWMEQINRYLGIPPEEVGVIGNNKEEIRSVTVGMVQTLVKRNLPEISQHFGQIIVDECHHTPASTFSEVVSAFGSFYQLGLSATPYRRDRLNKLLCYVVGNISATITDQDLHEHGTRIKPQIIARETLFDYDYHEDADYQPMISKLVGDPDRNRLIIKDVVHEAAENRNNYSLVLTDRKEHCKTLARLLMEQGVSCAILTGDLPKKQREQAIKDLEEGTLQVVLATGQIAGEGLDIPKLNRLFVTTPIRWKGKIEQYVGRVLRTAPGKSDARIYDYVDTNVGVLVSAYRSRCYQVYEQLS